MATSNQEKKTKATEALYAQACDLWAERHDEDDALVPDRDSSTVVIEDDGTPTCVYLRLEGARSGEELAVYAVVDGELELEWDHTTECSNCHEQSQDDGGTCTCEECFSCGDRYDQDEVCGCCYQCQNCCECVECSDCHDPTDDPCDDCGRCPSCCECGDEEEEDEE